MAIVGVFCANGQGSWDVKLMLPGDGDEVVMREVEAFVPTQSGGEAGQLWDMSRVSMTGDDVTANVKWRSDTTLSVTLPKVRRDFLLSGDTLRIRQLETHYMNIESEMGYPVLIPNQPIGGVSYSTTPIAGRIFQYHILSGNIDSQYSTIANGALILPGNERYENVTLTKTLRVMNYITTDSVYGCIGDSLLIYSWITPELQYPLAMTKITGGIEPVTTTMICMPGMNKPAELKIQKSRTQPDYETVGNGSAYNGEDNASNPNNPNKNNPLSGDDIHTQISGETLTVTINGSPEFVSQSENFTCILCDSQGRVYASGERLTATIEEMVFEIPVSTLPHGEYIIYIGNSHTRLHRKFIHRK